MNLLTDLDQKEIHIKTIYLTGGISSIIVILLTLLDIVIGSSLGGDLSTIPPSAMDRFLQFKENELLGLYNLDLLNMTVSFIMIPAFFALFIAHNRENNSFALLTLIIFAIGTTIFIANNSALPMLELSKKYIASTTDDQRIMYAAAGEAMIVQGAHGGFGVFPGFLLITISEIMISLVMLNGTIFSKLTGYIGLSGTILIFIYLILVTFVHSAKQNAMIFAAPGGLLSLLWMILYTKKLLQLAKKKDQLLMH